MAEQPNPPLNPLYFGVFLMFCACLIVQYGRFSFRYSWGIGLKKNLKNLILKKASISGLAQIGIFPYFWFFGFFVHNFPQNHPNSNVEVVLENLGNLQQDEHKNFQNWWRNVRYNGSQSWQPLKFSQQKLSHFEPPLKSYFFVDEIFQQFSYLYGLKVPKWNCAHILLWN